jgi:hypothetical protein
VVSRRLSPDLLPRRYRPENSTLVVVGGRNFTGWQVVEDARRGALKKKIYPH